MTKYYCLARAGSIFLVVDIEAQQYSCLDYKKHSWTIDHALFAKNNYLRPMVKKYDDVVILEAKNPSEYFTQEYVKKHLVIQPCQVTIKGSHKVSLNVLPIDLFIEECGKDPDLSSLLVLYGIERIYDRPIMEVSTTYGISNLLLDRWLGIAT